MMNTALGSQSLKIGLALSGGGFRASLFHLGVIRRLEELGIMRDVAVVSSVSGGSIIAAFYLVEMERRLRKLTTEERESVDKRVEIFEGIATDFIEALDHNLRTRALIFTPVYHPWLFLKTLLKSAFRADARSELIQAEYDKWFYEKDTLDQLPSVTTESAVVSRLVGPKLVINTTSLLTGESRSFSREPNTEMRDLKTPDRNFIRLSKVVGASSGVPVVFPPTAIRGELLVDGGVADNQGIEGLRENDCNILIVSDASGQMESVDTMRTDEFAVYSRVNDIFQFQIRNKLLELLRSQSKLSPGTVAFIHLYLNLKDWEAQQLTAIPRVSSEIIPALARIRTDLDQFSLIEREALMYHGYTLIDAVLKTKCNALISSYPQAKMRVAPLFAKDKMSLNARSVIRKDLEAGRESVFLMRTLKKYPRLVAPIYIGGLAAWIAGTIGLLWIRTPMEYITRWIQGTIEAAIPGVVESVINSWLILLNLGDLGTILHGISAITSFFTISALSLYFVLFWVFSITRLIARGRDLQEYVKIANGSPTQKWQPDEAEPEPPLKVEAVGKRG